MARLESPLLPYLDEQPPSLALTLDVPPEEPLPAVQGLLAGVADVDITPPPGIPKSGHSVNAQTGIGFRTRLHARVIHLRAGTTSLALIACDLHAGSSVIARLVARDIADDTDVRLSGVFMGATHTHAGPGQYHGCEFYNRMASNKPGFDPAYAQFMADQIAAGVREAVATRRPARVAYGKTEVWGFTRNRSLDAHVCNDSVDDKRLEVQRKYAAINPALHLVRVDGAQSDGGYAPLGALAIFSIHGTGISRHDQCYNADVWSYLTRELANRVEQRTGHRPVAGAIEGTHGDMTPAVRPGMLVYPEAERVGRGIGEAAAELHARLDGQLTDDIELGVTLKEIDLRTKPSYGGITLPGPAVGMAKLAGARENNTPVVDWFPPFRAGFPKPWGGGPHGRKWVIAAKFQYVAFPKEEYPRVLPIHVARIGPVAIVGVPFEVTVEAGRRLESSLSAAAGLDVIVSSVANDYWDYLTTAEEYNKQCYEGASNLYGPKTLHFVDAATRGLVTATLADGGRRADYTGPREYRLNVQRYMPKPSGVPATRSIIKTPIYHEATPSEDGYWEVRWYDGGPGDLDWHRPLVRVEADDRGTWSSAVDDGGWRIGVTHEGDEDGRHQYAARWYEPRLGAPQPHRFVLAANHGQPEMASQPFD